MVLQGTMNFNSRDADGHISTEMLRSNDTVTILPGVLHAVSLPHLPCELLLKHQARPQLGLLPVDAEPIKALACECLRLVRKLLRSLA